MATQPTLFDTQGPPVIPDYDQLVVDGSYLLHRILHAGGKEGEMAYQLMRSSSGIPTGGVFGCVKSLRAALNHATFQVRSVIVVWDGRPRKLSPRRVAIWPHYKNDPAYQPTDEDREMRNLYEDQRPRVEQALKLLGITSINLPEREGDDVVANVLKHVSGKTLVMSDDRDYLQLVGPQVHVYRAIKDYTATLENFQEKTGVKDPRRYLLYAAICGDGSDFIPGIPGVGDTTAQRLANALDLSEDGRFTYPVMIAALDGLKISDRRNAKRYQTLQGSLDIVVRNLMLVDLGLETLSPSEIQAMHAQLPAKFSEQEVLHWFSAYEFKSYLENWHQWSMPFRRLQEARLA